MSLPAAIAEAVDRSAAPAAVAVALERLTEESPDMLGRLSDDEALRTVVVRVFAASRALTQLCLADPTAIGVLADLDRRGPCVAEDVVRWQRLEYLRIAARDLAERASLEEVGTDLARMADDVFSVAAPPELAVIAMGKYGGRELNYASDVDVLFVGPASVDPRPVLEVARQCFRVDLDLRPEGRDGPLVRSLDAFVTYWDRWAKTWEFQALLKARAVGDSELGAAFERAASSAVWSRPFGAEEVREIRTMKARAEQEIAKRGLRDRELKRGSGGIRDIEFAVQLLQMVHGKGDPSLRSPTTLVTLDELAAAGYIDRGDASDLALAYRFLRMVEHRLQLWDGAQIHAIPASGEALDRLARVCGFRASADGDAIANFTAELRRHQITARSIHERLFFRPLLEAFSAPPALGSAIGSAMGSAMGEDAVAQRLAAFGFTSAARTQQAMGELTRGLTRASRLMQQMLPLLLEWLSQSPDPDDGLLGLRTLVTGQHRTDQLIRMFRDAPDSAQRLCLLLGSSRLVTKGLERHPELLPAVLDPLDGGRAAIDVGWRPVDERLPALMRLKHHEELRIEIQDLLGVVEVEDVGSSLTKLGEAVLAEALALAQTTTGIDMDIAIIAMGRFGGSELSYASDLDVIVVHDGDPAAAVELTTELRRIVHGATPAERLYSLDLDLRPEGRDGPLARSLEGYEQYYARWAQTWERQALLRGRFAVGSESLGTRYATLARSFLSRSVTADDEREIRRMKARIERERIPATDDPDFHLKLGRGGLADVEWTVQLLQLRHRLFDRAGTMRALETLLEAGHIDPADAAILLSAYRFCEHTRNRLYLVRGTTGDALPSKPEQLGKLARSLGTTGAELRDEYRRLTRRAREVTERIFYGRSTARPRNPLDG